MTYLDVVPSSEFHEPMSFWTWAHEHPILTILLAYLVLQTIVYCTASIASSRVPRR